MAATLAKADHLIELHRYAEARTELTGFLALQPDSEAGVARSEEFEAGERSKACRRGAAAGAE